MLSALADQVGGYTMLLRPLPLRGYVGILQADAYAGFKQLYAADPPSGPIT
jgi:hypothetical protein